MRKVAVVAVLSALVFVPAAVASAPSATTGPTTSLGATTATVSGTVDPGGQATTWYVEYGTTTAYGTKTGSASAGSGSSAVSVSASLSGLTPGTTYHYRVTATNGAGTDHGADAVFTTLVPPVATTGSASSVGATTATLNGTVDPNGRATSFYFEYGTSTSYGTTTSSHNAGSSTSPQAESAALTGLQAGQTYHFRLVATSDAGTSTGADATFTTSGTPVADTDDATSVTPVGATLNGKVTPNGITTTYWFEYGTTTSYGSKTTSQSAGTGTTAKIVSSAITGLHPATTYHFRLVAQNADGKTNGSDHSFTTVGPPAAQTGAASAVGPDTALLAGTLDTRGRTTTWWFDYGTTTSYGKSTPAKSGGSTAGTQAVSLTLTGLTPLTTYHFRLVAKSDGGTTLGADATFTTTGVTLTLGARDVVYGNSVRLSGIVPTHQAGEQVVLFAQAYGEGSPRSVATIVSTAGGVWVYLARPVIATTYRASWRNGMTAPVSVGVHPRLTVRRTRTGLFLVTALGGRSFAGRSIQLQRLVGGRWVTVRRARLGSRSVAEFRATLPRGRSTLRAAMSVNQAGGGFLGGVSGLLVVTLKH